MSRLFLPHSAGTHRPFANRRQPNKSLHTTAAMIVFLFLASPGVNYHSFDTDQRLLSKTIATGLSFPPRCAKQERTCILSSSKVSTRPVYMRLQISHLQVGLAETQCSSVLFSEGSTAKLWAFHLRLCAVALCLPAFFPPSSAAAAAAAAVAAVAAYMTTVGAYQSGPRVLSDEDHVLLSLTVVHMHRRA